jgi:integrase
MDYGIPRRQDAAAKAVYEQKQPYAEKEVAAILEAAGKINGGTTGYAKTTATFRVLIELMLETGLRVSDAVKFDPKRCVKSKFLWVYSFAQGEKNEAPKLLDVYLTAKLKKKIDACECCPKRFSSRIAPFRAPRKRIISGRRSTNGSRLWGRPAWSVDCRPHRVRDTFAARLLTKGVPLEDVSKLLGHASVAVRRNTTRRGLRLGSCVLSGS